MINSDFKDKIEDALIHFEDKGYSFQIYFDFYLDNLRSPGNSLFTGTNNKVYDLLKKYSKDDEIEFGNRVFIRLQRNSIMSWKEYQWFHSELRVAISRIIDNTDKVEILEGEATDITIKDKSWKFKNLEDLSKKCRYFNQHAKYLNKVIVYPEYHVEEGIVLYVREVPDSADFKRFSLLDKSISQEYYSFSSSTKLQDNDVFITTKKPSLNVSLEKAFGKDCILKRYEKGEAEIENKYLIGSHLSNLIVAKINCDFIKV